MVSCHPGDRIAGDYIHTDIKTCIIEEPQRSIAWEQSVLDLPLEWGGYILLGPNPLTYNGLKCCLSRAMQIQFSIGNMLIKGRIGITSPGRV